MTTVLLILWVIFNFLLIKLVFESSNKMWYYRGRRDSYQHMLDDVEKWKKAHPKMDVNEHWDTAIGLKHYKEIREKHENN